MKILFLTGFVLAVLGVPARAQIPAVGLFTDDTGADCSLVAGDSGFLELYVVVDCPTGVSAVEFMAPPPVCFNATYIGETSPFPATIGNSQTGIAIGLGGCYGTSAHVLTISYMITGSTGACCIYPVLPSPGYGDIRIVDCDQTIVSAVTVESSINGTDTCFCGINPPPTTPSNPVPQNGRVAVDVVTTLGWDSTDPQGDPLTFDVCFGTAPDPPLVAADLAVREYTPDILAFDTRYYWKITVKDDKGNEVPGPEWHFTTAVSSHARLTVPRIHNWCGPAAGDTVIVDVSITDSEHPVGSGGFDLAYDNTQLVYVGCSPGDLTGAWETFSSYDMGSAVRVAGSNPSPIPAGSSGAFAQLIFLSDCCGADSATASTLCPGNTTGDLRALWPVCGGFECGVFSADGDVNLDGTVTPGDALCALQGYLEFPDPPGGGCGTPGWDVRSDVDCGGTITPSDALCIFHFWLDGSCAFCSAGGPAVAERGGPVCVTAGDIIRTGNGVVVKLAVSGVDELDAFGFDVRLPAGGIRGVSVAPARATAGFDAVKIGGYKNGFARVGAYASKPVVTAGTTDLVELRFVTGPGPTDGTVTIGGFVDDLAGAGELSIDLAGRQYDTPEFTRYELYQNHPNPFNPVTEIRYEIPDAAVPGRVTLTVYNVRGERVRVLSDARRGGGLYREIWDGRDDAGSVVSSGVYFYVLRAEERTITRKMVLLR